MSKTPNLIPLKAAAELVGYSRGYIKILSDQGEFPEVVRIGNSDRIHFREREVRHWIAKRKRTNGGKVHRMGGRPRKLASRNPRKIAPIGERFMTMERDIADLLNRVAELEGAA